MLTDLVLHSNSDDETWPMLPDSLLGGSALQRSAERIPFRFQIQPNPEKADVRGRSSATLSFLRTPTLGFDNYSNDQAEILMRPDQNGSCHLWRTHAPSPLHSGTPPHGGRPRRNTGSLYERIKRYVKHPSTVWYRRPVSPITAFCFPAAGWALCQSMQAQNRRMVLPDPRDVQRDPSCS